MTYRGAIEDGRRTIWTSEAVKLCPRTDLYEYSDVFAWGELAGGTYQSAVSLLAEHFYTCAGGRALAKALHVDFAKEVVAKLSPEWEMTREAINEWLWNKIVECPSWFKDQVIRVLRDDARSRWLAVTPQVTEPPPRWVTSEIRLQLVIGIGIHEDKVAETLDFLMK